MKPITHFLKSSVFICTVVLAGLVLSGCSISLAEDITPPPNYRPPASNAPAQKTVSPQESGSGVEEVKVEIPQSSADPIEGKQIYTEKCLACHGEQGMGDGPQAGSLPNPAAPVGSSELARKSRPEDWYQIVTVGNLSRFMPGFQSLDDQERWNVVAYLYTLSTPAEELAQGKALYEENCAECHGVAGQGDGESAADLTKKPGDWSDPLELAALSSLEIAELIAEGQGEMPAFGDRLTSDEQLALAAYVRSLSFAQPGVPSENASEGKAAESLKQVDFAGQIQNASTGGKLPEGLTVSLMAFNGMSPAFTLEGTVEADGSYRFEDVEFNSEYVYVAQAQANGMNYSSDIVHGADISGEVIDLPIEVYDTTTDISSLRADRLHVFFDFTQPGKVQVVQLFIVSNPSDRVVVAPSPDQAVLNFELPADATNLQFEDSELGQRYIETPNGFGDRAGVSPGMGQHQVLFAYDLPYDRSLDLQLVSPLSVDAAVIMVPDGSVKLRSDQLTDAGEQNVQGMAFQMYQTTGVLEQGQPIKLELSGRTGSGTAGADDTLLPIFIGGGIFLAVAAGGGFWFYRQRQVDSTGDEETDVASEEEDQEESSEALLDAIITLDDLFQAGKLPEPAYQERRAYLKARLAEVIKREESA